MWRPVEAANVGQLGPGQYWAYRQTTRITKIDIRPRFISIPGQEVLTSDAVTLRVSVAAEYQVVDPILAINEIEDFQAALYLTLQLALREIIGATPIDELLEQRNRLGERFLELSRHPVEAIGLKLERVDLKDIMFPGDLKKTFAQVAPGRRVSPRWSGLGAKPRLYGTSRTPRGCWKAIRP